MGQPTHAFSDHEWWRSAVIYQVYVRSFADGDGDGTGDLAGVRSRLPYLAELGVDALWFNPWYRSPMKDGGYDVADYRAIDPAFGTLAEAEKLIDEARSLGIRTIIDIVPNHVSDQHPWFRAALAAGPGSPERDLFHFRPGRGAHGELPPNDWPSQFAGTTEPVWTRLPDGDWYLHLFTPNSPTSTGPTRRSARSTRTSSASGSTEGSPVSASTPRPCSPRTRTSRTSPHTRSRTRSWTATNSTTSTAPGAPSPTPTAVSSSARSGSPTPSASPAICAPTNSTPPSTSPSCPALGTPDGCAPPSTPHWPNTPRSALPPPGCCATTTSPARSPATVARTPPSTSPPRPSAPRPIRRSAPAGRGPPPCCPSRCPGRCTCTRGGTGAAGGGDPRRAHPGSDVPPLGRRRPRP